MSTHHIDYTDCEECGKTILDNGDIYPVCRECKMENYADTHDNNY